jgi:hypothetical protein
MIGDFVFLGETLNIFDWYFIPGWLSLLALTKLAWEKFLEPSPYPS